MTSRRFRSVLLFFLLFSYIGAESASLSCAEQPNVLLICIDDLRPELRCFGVDYVSSPNIDRLASRGRIFARHYVQAPTCGASRFSMLTGTYGPAGNGALFQRASNLQKSPDKISPSMPAWFRKNGYTTVSVGKVSHHPGGRGGTDWNDNNQPEMPESWDRHLLSAGDWQHPRGWMHGLANGEIRTGKKLESGTLAMDVFQSTEGDDSIYPDGGSTDEAITQLKLLASDEDNPFFLAVGILRPHLPFGAPQQYLERYAESELPPIPFSEKPKGKTTWHGSGEFMKYNRWGRNPNKDLEFATDVRKHYSACVSYADAQVGRLLEQLEQSSAAENTIVVLWGDHGWHLGEHQIWGKHSLFEESLRSPLIVSYPNLADPGLTTKAVVETIDLFPTLCDLAGITIPDFVDGSTLRPQLEEPEAAGRFAISYRGNAKTIRTDSHRMVLHRDGFVELYDHRTNAKESMNVASDQLGMVKELTEMLNSRLE